MKSRPDKNYWFLDMVIGRGGEAAEIAREIKRDYIEGKIKDVPRTYLGCEDWEMAFLYCFQRAHVAADDFIKKTGEKVTDISLVGPDFNDRIVVALEKIKRRIGPNRNLKELRLFRTGFSHQGLNQLKSIFPDARITLFDEKQEKENPKLFWINRNDV